MSLPRDLLARVVLVLIAVLGGACAAPVDDEEPSSSDSSELRRYVDAGYERPEVGVLRTESGDCTDA